MKSRFIKNNALFLVISGICGLVALTLLVFVLMQYIKMSVANGRVTEYRNNIKELISEKPAPVDGNKPRIQADLDAYRRVSSVLRGKFGRPYQLAVNAFIQTLKEVPEKDEDGADKPVEPLTEERFITMFKEGKDGEGWNNHENDFPGQKYYLENKFKVRFKNWNEAAEKFRELAQQHHTSEQITGDNIDEIILWAMGIDRQLAGNQAMMMKIYSDFREELLNVLGDTLPLVPPADTFGFNSIDGKAFATGDYAFVINHIDVLNDAFRRIKGCGLKMLHSVNIRSNAAATNAGAEDTTETSGAGQKAGYFSQSVFDEGGYEFYHNTIEVTGTMEAIRKVAPALAGAYQDRRIYIVRSVALYAEENGANAIFAPLFTVADENNGEERDQQQQVVRRGRRRIRPSVVAANPDGEERNNSEEEARRQREEAEKRFQEMQARLPYKERVGYGEILVGAGEEYRAVFDIDYAVLKRQ